ncbi:hypothetical protein K7432_009679 [Basidiobolus ranarum]|uniref:Calcium uniporter protein, mitochondrial n=1 Tax=Basidiobolus ranarum TaxID=34480 RepID=A0ABR2VWQ4_9FUNG
MISLLRFQSHDVSRSLFSAIKSRSHVPRIQYNTKLSYSAGARPFSQLHVKARAQTDRKLSTTPQADYAISVEEKLGNSQSVHLNTKKIPNRGVFHSYNSLVTGKLKYDTDDENPMLIIPSSTISNQQSLYSEEFGAAFPFSLNLPLSVMSYQIREEYPQLKEVSFHESSDAFNPSIKYSQHFKVKDVIQKAIKSPCGGFFLSINGNQLFIQIPTFKERTTKLENHLLTLEERLRPLRELKEKCDMHASNTNRKLVTGGMAGLCTYFGIMAKLTWWDYGWDGKFNQS